MTNRRAGEGITLRLSSGSELEAHHVSPYTSKSRHTHGPRNLADRDGEGSALGNPAHRGCGWRLMPGRQQLKVDPIPSPYPGSALPS